MKKSLGIFSLFFLSSSLFTPVWSETNVEQCREAYIAKDFDTAYPSCLSAAEQGDDVAQHFLGFMYDSGKGVKQDYAEAAVWYRKAAEQGNPFAQSQLGLLYADGSGVKQDSAEAAFWFRKSTEPGDSEFHKNTIKTNLSALQYLAENEISAAQYELARRDITGDGVEKNRHLAEKWLLRSIANDDRNQQSIDLIEKELGWHCILTDENRCRLLIHTASIRRDKNLSWYWSQYPVKIISDDGKNLFLILKDYAIMNCDNRSEGRKERKALNKDLIATSFGSITKDNEIEFEPLDPGTYQDRIFNYVCGASNIDNNSKDAKEVSFGTGWPIQPGYIVTNQHVVSGKNNIAVMLATGEKISATILIEDKINDLALLQVKNPRKLPPALPVAKSSTKTGSKVFTIGYPHPDIMGAKPKLTEGIVNAVTGYMDDPRTLQISVPVQSGNSGGPLLNMNGEVVGIVTAKLSAVKMFNWTGDLPQNVNYSVKAPYLTALLSSVNGQSAGIKLLPIKQANLESLSSRIQNSILMIIAE